MSILIVDDNPVNVKLLELMVQNHGHQTLSATGAVAALADVTSGGNTIDLIIVDYMMPDMNGLEFMSTVKQLSGGKDIPIILITAYAEPKTVKAARELKCTDVLAKPINKKALLTKIDVLLNSRPPILRAKKLIMSELEATPMEYADLMNVFISRIDAVLPIVVLEQGDLSEMVSENCEQLLKELAESAAILGADRFVALYTQLKKQGHIPRSECPALLKTLQELSVAVHERAPQSPVTDTSLEPNPPAQ